MTFSVRRSLRFFNWLRHQERAVQSVNQGTRALNVSSQISGNNLVCNGNALNQANSFGAQCNPYQTVDMAQSGSLFEVNEGGVGAIGNSQAGVFAQGLSFAQSNLLSDQQNCRDGAVLSLKARFGRSCRAFVNAWRQS
jgi:hypothetical protein